MSHFVSQPRHATIRTHVRDPNLRHGGFQNLEEYVHPKLRPAIHINTVRKLIVYKFERLQKMVEVVVERFDKCGVFLPWSHMGWAFNIFQPSAQVKAFITHLANAFESQYDGRPDVCIIKNVWDPADPLTDYKHLVTKFNDILLVFGDNTTGTGYGGSAAVRDRPNAFGIPTGWSDSYGVWADAQEQRFRDQNYLEYELEESTARQELARVREIETREATLFEKEKQNKARELALRQKETALSQKEARFSRRTSKH